MGSPAQHATSRTAWFKSSYSSSTGTCVEIRFDGGQVAVRDSKNLNATAGELIVNVAAEQWATFASGLQA